MKKYKQTDEERIKELEDERDFYLREGNAHHATILRMEAKMEKDAARIKELEGQLDMALGGPVPIAD